MNAHKIDDIQRASIRRSEAYLRKKAAARPVSYARESAAGAAFALLTVMVLVILLSL